jgi:hypothetical protein
MKVQKSEQPSKEDIQQIIADVSPMPFFLNRTNRSVAQIQTHNEGCLAAIFLLLYKLCSQGMSVKHTPMFFLHKYMLSLQSCEDLTFT